MKYDFNTFIEQYTAFVESGQHEESNALLQDYKLNMAHISEYILDMLNETCSQLENYTGEQDKNLDRAIDMQWNLYKQYMKD